MGSIKKILPPQPHYLSGYTGFVPGFKFLCGQSYGRLTHDLFLDRKYKREMVLTDLSAVQGDLLTQEEKKLLNERCNARACTYVNDMKPGYGGHIPQYIFLCGHDFTGEASVALSKSEAIKRACLCPHCEEIRGHANQRVKMEDINRYTYPSTKIRGGEKIIKETYAASLPMPPSATPYFLDNDDPQKKFMAGYVGHVPGLTYQHGLPYTPASNEALKIFGSRYHRLKSSLRVPITSIEHSKPKFISQKLPYETGIIKNYAGHIPGNKFNVGQTFSEGSKHTRKILNQ